MLDAFGDYANFGSVYSVESVNAKTTSNKQKINFNFDRGYLTWKSFGFLYKIRFSSDEIWKASDNEVTELIKNELGIDVQFETAKKFTLYSN